jgi:phosphoribosylformylglycinamidine synthase
MVTSVIDEAVRKIVAAGGDPERIAGLDNFCWPDPVESPKNADGRYKLAQLVRANQALYDVTVAYGVPCISGKDSMKNDSVRGGVKISIPPSLLFSAVGKIDDVRKAVTLDFKVPGDLIYVIGETKPELGASEYVYMLSEGDSNPAIGNRVHGLNPDTAMKTYRAVHRAVEQELIHSLHTPTLGGLAVGFAMMSMAGELGAEINLKVPGTSEAPGTWRSDAEILFSESNSRFIAAVAPENGTAFEDLMAGIPCALVGKVTEETRLTIEGQNGVAVITANIHELKQKWKEPLDGI